MINCKIISLIGKSTQNWILNQSESKYKKVQQAKKSAHIGFLVS